MYRHRTEGGQRKKFLSLKSCMYYTAYPPLVRVLTGSGTREPRPRSDLTFSAGGTGRGEHLVFRMKYDTSMRFGFLFRIRGGAHTRPVHARLPAVARTCVRQEVRPCGCAPLCAYVRPLKPKPPGTLWHLVAPCGTLWHPVVPMWYRPSFSMQTDTKPRSTGESWFSTF